MHRQPGADPRRLCACSLSFWVHRSFVQVDLESLVFFVSPSPSGKYTPVFSFTSLFPQYRQHIQLFLSVCVALFEIYFCFMCFMSEHHLYAVPLMATRGHQIPLELKSACCKRPCEYWESNQGPLEEQPVFLTAAISQPHILHFTSFFVSFDSSFQVWSLVMNFMLCGSLCTKLEVPFVIYFLNQRQFVCPFFFLPLREDLM